MAGSTLDLVSDWAPQSRLQALEAIFCNAPVGMAEISPEGIFLRLVDGALELTIAGSYSRLGYSARSRLEHWAPADRVDGRVVLVTGATSGIGRSIAAGLAGLGAVVIVVGRDESRGQSTVKGMIERTGNSG